MTKSEFIEQLTVLRDMIQGTLDLAAKEAAPVEPPAEGLPVVALPNLDDPEDQYDILGEIDDSVQRLFERLLEGRHGRNQ